MMELCVVAPATGRPKRTAMLVVQPKRMPQASQRPWVRSHATEKTMPERKARMMVPREAPAGRRDRISRRPKPTASRKSVKSAVSRGAAWSALKRLVSPRAELEETTRAAKDQAMAARKTAKEKERVVRCCVGAGG